MSSNQTTQTTTEATRATDQLPLWKDGRNGIQFVRSFSRLEKEEPRTYKLLNLVEGFECEDNNFVYKIGKSKYGLWLSRKKKNIVVVDLSKDSSSNNDNIIMKPEARPTGFMTSNSDNNSNGNNNNNNNNDSNEQSLEQQNHQQQTFEYSIKLEETQKNVRVSVHVYSHDKEQVRNEAIDLLLSTKEELRKKGLRVIESESVGTGEVE